MTTVQTMLRCACPAILACACAVSLSACNNNKDRLDPPQVLVAPYDSARNDVLWAVVPLANETGVSFADSDMISDALVAKIDEVRGLACLPLNRTIAAMRAANLRAVTSPAQARALAGLLGVDGIVVGSITDYDPYNPPKVGLKLALFSREADAGAMAVDPLRLQTAYSDYSKTPRTQYLDRPVSTVSEYLDGANHEVLMELQRYATGRHDTNSALGWKRMLTSMDLYTQFAANMAVARLIEQERLRLGQPAMTSAEPTTR